MCWMLVKPAGKQVDFRKMDRAQKHNSDGYGCAWYEDGRVKTYKTFNYKQFKGIVRALKGHQVVAHLRYATRGIKEYENIHPFDTPSGVMFHNGTVKGFGSTIKSDSKVLADTISRCDYNFIEDIEPLIAPFIADKINRLVFFEDNGRVTIMNEHLGITEDGIWYSNDYHKKDKEWCRFGCNAKLEKKDKHEVIDITPIKKLDRFNKVFVYGTLKRGYYNNRLLKDATFLGKAKTTEKWVMIGKGRAFPYIIEKNEEIGEHISGEVFAVNNEELNRLDTLEGVPYHYVKEDIKIMYEDDFTIDSATLYIKAGKAVKYVAEDTLKEWIG